MLGVGGEEPSVRAARVKVSSCAENGLASPPPPLLLLAQGWLGLLIDAWLAKCQAPPFPALLSDSANARTWRRAGQDATMAVHGSTMTVPRVVLDST